MLTFVRMDSHFLKYKGIHPGIVLGRELKKRSIKQRAFARSIGEYPQTLNAIIKGRRSIPIALALKMERELEWEEGVIALLQTYFDIEIEKQKLEMPTPNLEILRTSLFWDTDIDSLDWQRQFKAVIKRVFERGNKEEQKEIIRFYGDEKVSEALKAKKTLPMQIETAQR